MIICPHERQVYFDQTLPCARPGCVGYERQALVSYWRKGFEWTHVRSAAVRIIFRTDGERWHPEPCLARGVDANMDDAIDAAGLSAALVTP